MIDGILLSLSLVVLQPQPTAEALLEALRHNHPVNEVIPPASALQHSSEPERPLLLPEGAAVVDHAGRLNRDGNWWTLVPVSDDAFPPTKLLPNANLEVMVETARGSDTPITFLVSGEMTVFRDENYLLVRLARRQTSNSAQAVSDQRQPQGGFATGADSDGSDEASPSATGDAVVENAQVAVDAPAAEGTLVTREKPSTEDIPVEQVLAALETKEPSQPVLSATPDITGGKHTAAASLRADGSTIVRRPGRLVREKDWWLFTFESDSANEPELPMRLLPNKSAELMTAAVEQEANGLVFLVTGDVTLFEGHNYLLPRMAVRRIDLGNLTK